MSLKKVVVKIGSSLLTDVRGALDEKKLKNFVAAIANCHKDEVEYIIVSSGSIAAGFTEMGYTERPKEIKHRQAAAAVGQGLLMHAYREAFAEYGLTTGQLLLSPKDFARRDSYNNALSTMSLLLEKKVIPIINENDSVATKDLAFGDNDMLSALVATLLHADLLIILTDIDGLYSDNPRENPAAEKIQRVESITKELLAMANNAGSSVGTGGMLAKIKAADVALSMGCCVYIGSGAEVTHIELESIVQGLGSGTYFGGVASPMQRKKQWIAYHSSVCGSVIIDAGAKAALLEQGNSLLPVGIESVQGDFTKEQVVRVLSSEAELLGKGISRFSSEDLKKVLGKSSAQVKSLLSVDKAEAIHRDNWVPLVHER